MYKIEPANSLPEGYNSWDYLRSMPTSFDTEAEAQSWLSANHLGPDEFGVNAEFEVVEV